VDIRVMEEIALTAMNVQGLKRTVVIQMHYVITLRDLIFVVA